MGRTSLWVAMGLVLVAGCESSGPQLEVPTPAHERYTGVDLQAVHAVSLTDIWAVGTLGTADGAHDGLLLHTEDGGGRWRRAGSEIHELENVSFHSLFFADRIRGWIGARRITPEGVHRAVIFRTKDGGNRFVEDVLPAGDGVRIADVHSVAFKSDTEGSVVVSYSESPSGPKKESLYETTDGGRTWTVTAFQQDAKVPTKDRLVSYVGVNPMNGFRLRKSERPGITLLEKTASGGKDWMPVSEFGVGYVPTYY